MELTLMSIEAKIYGKIIRIKTAHNIQYSNAQVHDKIISPDNRNHLSIIYIKITSKHFFN